ncbi:MAG: aminotransferase class V-fold PLP-dependent enzyme [Nibricoccus sp.]
MDPVYLDCAATTPIEPAVAEAILQYTTEEFGNAGSRTHEYGNRAKVAVQKARSQVGQLVGAPREDVIFTSGATESNNLAILGLAAFARTNQKMHIITSSIEHKAVLEPFHRLSEQGFKVTCIAPGPKGFIEPDALSSALTADTSLVSLMQVNNETGVIQPLSDYCKVLRKHHAFFHVDGAQGIGKLPPEQIDPRIDLISVSAHKLYGPKGIGALIYRRRDYKIPPIAPLMYGGGQERGLRPGTLPVPLVVGFGLAADLALKNQASRYAVCQDVKSAALKHLLAVGGIPSSPTEQSIASTLNISFPGLDSEAIMLALKSLIAISNGSACTSQNYTASHVLTAMQLDPERVRGSIRLSWSHLTPMVPWSRIAQVIAGLKAQ